MRTPSSIRLVVCSTVLCALLAACSGQGASSQAQPTTAAPTAAAVATTVVVTKTVAPAAPSATPAPTLAPSATAAPTLAPSATAAPAAALGAAANISGYVGYRVKAGDSLAAIASAGGSDPDLIMRYNLLSATPQVGRELMIPQIAGRPAQLPAPGIIVIRGNTTKPWIALTLDCGNTYRNMGPILDILRKSNIKLTFFITGNLVEDEESPALLRQMAADGHEIGHHSYKHPDYSKISDEEIIADLAKNEVLMQRIFGPEASMRPFFRFPYGAYDRRALDVVLRAGYLPIHWSLDTLDAWGEPKTGPFIVERVMRQTDKDLRGAIVLGHCTNAIRDALPTLIERLYAAGYELRTLSDVLGE